MDPFASKATDQDKIEVAPQMNELIKYWWYDGIEEVHQKIEPISYVPVFLKWNNKGKQIYWQHSWRQGHGFWVDTTLKNYISLNKFLIHNNPILL